MLVDWHDSIWLLNITTIMVIMAMMVVTIIAMCGHVRSPVWSFTKTVPGHRFPWRRKGFDLLSQEEPREDWSLWPREFEAQSCRFLVGALRLEWPMIHCYSVADSIWFAINIIITEDVSRLLYRLKTVKVTISNIFPVKDSSPSTGIPLWLGPLGRQKSGPRAIPWCFRGFELILVNFMVVTDGQPWSGSGLQWLRVVCSGQ